MVSRGVLSFLAFDNQFCLFTCLMLVLVYFDYFHIIYKSFLA